MSLWSLPSWQHTTESSKARFRPIILAVAVVLAGACWQPCHAQQIPRRVDTSNYQNRGPTAPKTELPGPLTIERVRSPETGKPIKVYRKPSLDRQPQQPVPVPQVKEPSKRTAPQALKPLANGEITRLTQQVEDLKKKLEDLNSRLNALEKNRRLKQPN